MNQTDLNLARELIEAAAQTDTWEAIMQTDPGIVEATNKFRVMLSRLSGKYRGPGRYEEDLSSTVWALVNAYTQAASLYGYHVSRVLQEAAGRPQELTAYMRETETGGASV